MHGTHLLVDPSTRPAALVLGALLLLAGRRLFWLLVGAVGFFAAYSLSLQSLHLQSASSRLVVAVVVGLLGVLLAIFVQKVAIAVAGFVLGAYFAAALLGASLAHAAALTPSQSVIVLVAGVLAALLAVRLFDLALIALSAIAGAGLVGDALQAGGNLRWLLVVVLATVGIAIQMGWSRRARTA